MSEDTIKSIALKYALQNAVQFDGKANPKAVIGKVIGLCKKDDINPKEVIPVVNSTIQEVNSMDVEQQRKRLEELAPELLIKEKKQRDFSLPPLPKAIQGDVVTRFPPEPNGFLHIGHAKAALIDYEYARMYEGKFILRFDDTNPEKEDEKFYEAQKDDLRWLGIEWDEEYCTSDHIPTHYELAEKLIREGNAYVCCCKSEDIKTQRYTGQSCPCTTKMPDEHLRLWKEMLDGSSNYILRLRADMKSDNTAMRDPTLFRIIEKPHPRTGTQYRVWPTYDFTGAVEDSIGGVTHPFRTKEYELRDEVYFYLLSLLELRHPHLMEFARLNINSMPISKRKIKPLIDEGVVEGFSDFRLPTLQGLKRRGITPQGIKTFVFQQGISKVESTVDFSIVEACNRKALDPIAKRYFFVSGPVKLTVTDAPAQIAQLKLHPTEDFGVRTISTQGEFYISKDDATQLNVGDTFRLKELYNVVVDSADSSGITGHYGGEELIQQTSKIQWTTATDYTPLTVFVSGPLLDENGEYNSDSLKKIQGYAESSITDLAEGEIIQFERFGFVRLERKDGTIQAIYSHK